ncbi:HAD-IB family hydrolase [Photorhabdus stackebrandtii]|uniref:HAD-IB family hydrolase n=1 Tax=Photorhabdus stackebrandtii TaxID=1123042 RepID=A0A7X5TLI3_9GAMM|nr:HAD-IB family hydrolase [Photorhabdus stackebrandtii]
MKRIAAFFDVDETLIKMKSMFHFYQFWCHCRQRQHEYNEFNERFITALSQGAKREELNRMYYRQLSGVYIDELYQEGENWFNKFLEKDEIYISSAIDAFYKHQTYGHLTVFISGSMLPLLKPLGRYLGVDVILCTQLLLNKEGKLTGEIDEPQTIGEGKKKALTSFSYSQDIDLENSFAYGDDLSDVSMLEATGNPVCVGDNTNLAAYARRNDWEILTESTHIY